MRGTVKPWESLRTAAKCACRMQGDTRAELRFEIEDLLSVAMLGLAELSVGNDVEAVHFQFALRDKCDYSS